MKKKLTDILYSFSLLLFITAFGFQHNPPEGWYQQFMPDLGGRQINDITFTDSLNGYAITSRLSDTSYIIKTTNGGDNWFLIHSDSGSIFNRLHFINHNTGFVGGLKIVNTSFLNLLKTTNAGANWFYINAPFDTYISDMSVLNEDTIWFAMESGFGGGVFRTTNGGQSWTQQAALGSNNPTNIYFYNKDTGYAAAGVLYKTTNSGNNWFQIPGGGFGDMHFINATTGWKCYGPMQKTTDGGLSWENVPLPPKSDSLPLSRIYSFHNINKDTMWGVGSVGVIGSVGRGLINITTDGGTTWKHQLPDTSINIFQYYHIQFDNKLIGWAYGVNSGVHTITGGVITSINQISSEIPIDFKLFQNYPNPFNPETFINYEIRITSYVKLKVFDVTGRIIKSLVDERQNAGTYQYSFVASGLSSGVYFYTIEVETEKGERFIDTKKMVLQK